jgi:hypothetical protein
MYLLNVSPARLRSGYMNFHKKILSIGRVVKIPGYPFAGSVD